MKKCNAKRYKVIPLSIILYIFISTYTMSYANSGPTIMEAYPGSEMIVDESSEISVNRELLTFDLASDLYTQGAKVVASYSMVNTSDQIQNVHMVFPLISTINRLQDTVNITNDGDSVPLEKTYLDRVNSPKNLPDFKTLINQTTEKAPFLTSDLVCYEFIPQTSIDEMSVEVQFNLTDNDSHILVQNANGYGYDNGKYIISGWFSTHTKTRNPLMIYITKGDLKNLEYTVTDRSSDKIVDQSTQLESLKVRQTTLSISDMNAQLEKILFAQEKNEYTQTEKEWMLNEALYELHDMYDMPMIMLDELAQYLYRDRIVLLSYEIPFEPKQAHEITVTYQMKGTFDRSNSTEPTYTFEYFLNPASYWKSFENLELKINLESPYNYIISSSLPLERITTANQISYQAVFDHLPESDLTFTVYTAEKITALDELRSDWNKSYSYIFFLIVLPLMGIILIVGGLAWLIHKVRKK